MKTIAVFGSSRRADESELYREAYELGRLLAQAGYAVLTGGYNGSMAAVSRGAAEAGGRVIGVTCAIFDPLPPNPWLTEEIKARTLLERLAIMIDRSDGFVAVRGGIGTLSEVTLAWSLLQTRQLAGKPLVLLGADWPPLVDALRRHSDLGESIARLARIVLTPAEVLSALSAPPIPPGPPPLG
ncbi:MAG: LOG family protein [Anaerolineae bacterium]